MTAEPEAGRRAHRRRRTRADLVGAALDLIAAEGTDGVGIDALVAGAEVARGTLYAHFPGGRDEILVAAYRLVGERTAARAAELLEERTDWIDRMTAHLESMIEVVRNPGVGIFYTMTGPQLAGMDRRGVGSSAALACFTDELARAVELGEVPSALDVAATAALLVGAVREAGIDVARDPASADRSIAAFRLLLGALRPAG